MCAKQRRGSASYFESAFVSFKIGTNITTRERESDFKRFKYDVNTVIARM